MKSFQQGHKMNNNNEKKGWTIDKSIPLAFILAVTLSILIQVGSSIWWSATVTNKLENVILQVSDIKSNIYMINDAERDKELYKHKFESINNRIDKIEYKISK